MDIGLIDLKRDDLSQSALDEAHEIIRCMIWLRHLQIKSKRPSTIHILTPRKRSKRS